VHFASAEPGRSEMNQAGGLVRQAMTHRAWQGPCSRHQCVISLFREY
jgi:hypothetical protein